jgi:hypothetical protein
VRRRYRGSEEGFKVSEEEEGRAERKDEKLL